MLELAWPWIAAVAPAPLLVRALVPRADHAGGQSLRVPFFAEARRWRGPGTPGRPGPRVWLAMVAWLVLVLAACRPQWLGESLVMPVTGRDLLLAVDISGSMKTRDLSLGGERVSRLDVVKAVAGEFIERRLGDRIGLVLFGSRPYLQTPLTFDRRTVRTLLDESVIGLAGEQTAIGDALGLSVKRLRSRPESHRVVVLLTDGANTTGEVPPMDAARLAAAEGLRVYTIGVGAEEMRVRGVLGSRRVNPSADLDEPTLRAIADLTGGRFFRARDSEELEGIYALLDRFEPVPAGDEVLRPRRELFHWPLGAALVLAMALAAPGAAWGFRVWRDGRRFGGALGHG